VASCAFSAQCVYSKLGYHPHPLGYLCLCAKFSVASIAKPARGEKKHTQSITHSVTHPAYLMPRNQSFLFGKILHTYISNVNVTKAGINIFISKNDSLPQNNFEKSTLCSKLLSLQIKLSPSQNRELLDFCKIKQACLLKTNC